MFLVLLVVHIIISVVLVLAVLLQSGRGAELGAAFGGVGQSQMGRAPVTLVTKITAVLAFVFLMTSLSLAFLVRERPSNSVVSEPPALEANAEPTEAEQTTPADGKSVEQAEAVPIPAEDAENAEEPAPASSLAPNPAPLVEPSPEPPAALPQEDAPPQQ